MLFIKHKSIKGNNKSIESDKRFVVVVGVLASGLGLGRLFWKGLYVIQEDSSGKAST